MHPLRRYRILRKLAAWPWGESAAVQGAKANFAAGGTPMQQYVGIQQATIPSAMTLQDRVRIANNAVGKVDAPWRKQVSTMYEVPQGSTGSRVADRALDMVKKREHYGFSLGNIGMANKCAPGTDCSTFASAAAGVPRHTTSGMYADAMGAQKYFQRVPSAQMRAGDFMVYPNFGTGGKQSSGHVGVVVDPNRMLIADSSMSGWGPKLRIPPSEFANQPTIAIRPRTGGAVGQSTLPQALQPLDTQRTYAAQMRAGSVPYGTQLPGAPAQTRQAAAPRPVRPVQPVQPVQVAQR
jgi:cell wall-associated NlpC family hydrolase